MQSDKVFFFFKLLFLSCYFTGFVLDSLIHTISTVKQVRELGLKRLVICVDGKFG